MVNVVISTTDITVITAHISAECIHLGPMCPVHRNMQICAIRAVHILNSALLLDLFLSLSYTNLSYTKSNEKKNIWLWSGIYFPCVWLRHVSDSRSRWIAYSLWYHECFDKCASKQYTTGEKKVHWVMRGSPGLSDWPGDPANNRALVFGRESRPAHDSSWLHEYTFTLGVFSTHNLLLECSLVLLLCMFWVVFYPQHVNKVENSNA